MHHCHTERPYRPEWRFWIHDVGFVGGGASAGSDADYQTVVQNILDEPVAEERKRRLFSALLLKAYQPISGPWDSKKVETPNPLWGWKDLTLFIRWIMDNPNRRKQSGLTFWKDVRMIWSLDCRIFRSRLQERKKQDGTVNFRHTFGAASFTSAARGGWFVFVAPRKGVCSKQECAQLEVCNFSKMMVHRESLTQIGLRAEKNVAKHLLAENGWESSLVADVSKVDYLEGH